jgi:hypothetical protein
MLCDYILTFSYTYMFYLIQNQLKSKWLFKPRICILVQTLVFFSSPKLIRNHIVLFEVGYFSKNIMSPNVIEKQIIYLKDEKNK